MPQEQNYLFISFELMLPFMREKFAEEMHLWVVTFIATKEKHTYKGLDLKLLYNAFMVLIFSRQTILSSGKCD